MSVYDKTQTILISMVECMEISSHGIDVRVLSDILGLSK